MHVRPSLLNYRTSTSWLPHQVVAQKIGHGNYTDGHGTPGYGKPTPGEVSCLDGWNYLTLFIDKALSLRLPEKGFPTESSLPLRKVNPESGYLVETFAVEDIFQRYRHPLYQEGGKYVISIPKGIEDAKKNQQLQEQEKTEFKKRMDLNRKPESFVHRHTDVPEHERVHMMWLADEELAKAWVQFHDPATRQIQKP